MTLRALPVLPPSPARSLLAGARIRLVSSTALATIMMMAAAAPARASGSSMPWEEPLEQILKALKGRSPRSSPSSSSFPRAWRWLSAIRPVASGG